MNKGHFFSGIFLVLLLAGSAVVSARSSYDIADYMYLMDRYGVAYNAQWEGSYKGGTLYVNANAPAYNYYQPQQEYCSALGCYHNMWSYDVDFYGPQKVYPSYPSYSNYPSYQDNYYPPVYREPVYSQPSYSYYKPAPTKFYYNNQNIVSTTNIVYADRYYSGYQPNNFARR